MNTKALRNLSYGVYIISAWDKGRPVGCVANSVMQITSSPATIMLSVNHDNYTNKCINDCGYFSISILSETSQPSLIGKFGYRSSKDTNKFEDTKYLIKSSVPVIEDAMGFLVCKVVDKMETKTHTVFLGELIDADTLKDEQAMTYWYYHNVIKGKSPKNAPNYIPDEDADKRADK